MIKGCGDRYGSPQGMIFAWTDLSGGRGGEDARGGLFHALSTARKDVTDRCFSSHPGTTNVLSNSHWTNPKKYRPISLLKVVCLGHGGNFSPVLVLSGAGRRSFGRSSGDVIRKAEAHVQAPEASRAGGPAR